MGLCEHATETDEGFILCTNPGYYGMWTGEGGSVLVCDDHYDYDYDPSPCCPDPGCPGRFGAQSCTFGGYADNH